MPRVTILVVGFNNKDALRLTVESFRRHNADEPFLLWVWDNESTDGAQEWARDHADRLFVRTEPLGHCHAEPLDKMCQEVASPYTLTLDNDVWSRGPVLARLVDHLDRTGAFAVGPAARLGMGSVDHFGRLLHGQPRVDPCCALFRAPELARLTRSVSFTPYECVNRARFHDTGSMVRHAAEGAGLRVDDAAWLWGALTHYGSMTLGAAAPPGSPRRAVYDERHAQVLADAAALDAGLRAGAELVLARYQESVAWAAAVRDWRVTVYDKGGGGDTRLPNVGREAHTYAEHVARRYDDLPELTAFAQADPFAHVPDFPAQLAVPTAGFRALGPHRLRTGPEGDASHRGLPVGRVYRELTGRDLPAEVPFAPGACFLAHRSRLRRYPRGWWRRLADRLAAPEAQAQLPWVMERLWGLLLRDPGRPHFYHTIPGWFAAERLYRDAVREAPDGGHVVEVGAWAGRSSAFLAVEAANSGKRLRVDVVDHFLGSPSEPVMQTEARLAPGGTMRRRFEANLAPVAGVVTVVESDSVRAAARYPDRSLDFVFLDGAHDEAAVAADIRAYRPKVKPGGRIAGDDHTYAWPGVKAAVAAAFGGAADVATYPTLWVYRVPEGET